MLAHTDKENVLLHPPQTGKPNPRTPGLSKMATKTPFKIPLNNENTAMSLHAKADKKDLFASRDPSRFVTPVGHRRQALAGKTTNVKAKSLAPSARNEKTGRPADGAVKLHHSQLAISGPAGFGENDEFPEIEYMPPAPPEVPFVPEGFEGVDYGSLGKNYMRGCHRAYLAGIDEDGKSKIQRKVEANQRRLEAELDAETEALVTALRGIGKPRAPTARAKPSIAPGAGSIPAPKTRRTEVITARKVSEPKRSTSLTRSRSVSRPPSAGSTSHPASSRPTSSASVSRPTAPLHRGMASTLDSRKAAEMLSQRPTSSSSTHPEPRLNRHSRSGSTSTAPSKKPLSFSSKQSTAALNRSNSRTRSVSGVSSSALRSTIGYSAGREVRDAVKKAMSQVKLESTLDAIERIQREDEEAEANPPLILIPEEDENDVIVDFPSPLIEDEEEFFMTMPE